MAERSRTEVAMEALMAGKDVSAAVGDGPIKDEPVVDDPDLDADPDPVTEDQTPAASVDPDSTDDEETEEPAKAPADSKKPATTKASKESKPKTEPAKGDDEFAQVNYTDKKVIRKAFEEANRARALEKGMRQFQRERDQAKAEIATLTEKNAPILKLWEKLDAAFGDGGETGVDNVIQLLTKGEYSLESLAKAQAERMIKRQTASPADLRIMDAEDRAAAKEREAAKIQAKLAEIEQRQAAQESAAKVASLESAIHPAFAQYRFAGKLGDRDVEQRLDRTLWTNVREALEALPESEPITAEVAAQTFANEAAILSRMIRKQAETQATRIVTDRRVKAKEAAQSAAQEQVEAGGARQTFARQIKSGDLTGALTGLLQGKVRL